MLFNSAQFLIFFPAVVCLYFLLPVKLKNLWLLAASYFFYMCWNPKYGLLLLFTTVVTYSASRVIEFQKKQREEIRLRGAVFTLSLLVIFSLLFYFKYVNFFMGNLKNLLGIAGVHLNMPVFDILLPVGISFFTFQAAGYLIDVYRGDIYAEPDFFRYALFVSFFPQLVAGPIERSKNLLKQLDRTWSFDYERVREGIFLMLWGFFMKLVVADRTAIFVDQVNAGYHEADGSLIFLSALLFTVQIYCDFGGYSVIALGAAKVLGFQLIENFNCPFMAQSIQEFWRRWHVSLNTWFVDYLYIPLGGGHGGKMRKYRNILLVFLASGLWHGARWSYVFWGGLNGIYQIVGELTRKKRDRLWDMLHVTEKCGIRKLLRMLGTSLLFAFSMIFFRAPGFRDAVLQITRMITYFHPGTFFTETLFQYGLNGREFLILFVSILVLLLADILKYRGISVRHWILSRGWLLRELVLVGGTLLILVYGIWGEAYDARNFIYFQF